MPQKSPVGDIRRPTDKVEYVVVAGNVRLLDRGHDGYLWVHLGAVINITPVFANIRTNIQTLEGEVVPIAVYRYGHLVVVYDGWFNCGVRTICCVIPKWDHDTYQEFYIPSYFIRQQYLSRFFRTFHQIPSDTFPKQGGQ